MQNDEGCVVIGAGYCTDTLTSFFCCPSQVKSQGEENEEEGEEEEGEHEEGEDDGDSVNGDDS